MRHRSVWLGATCVFGIVGSHPGLAQAQATQPTVSPSTGAAEQVAETADIVVTAQKRAESIQKVPIAMSAFSGATLREANVISVFDLPKLAPSLHIDNGLSAAKARLTIRGVGTAGGSALEPSVATFVDGFYVPREGATVGSYYDLAAVEVLRGPQGTLFGRNASVGAISIRTALPASEAGGSFTIEHGSGRHNRVEGVFNLPVSDGLRFRLAGVTDLLGGYWHNRLDGRRLGGINTYAGRLTAQVDVAPDIEWTVRTSYSNRSGDAFAHYALLPDSLPTSILQTYIARYAALGNTVDLEPFDREVNQYSADDLQERAYDVNSTVNWNVGGGFSVRLLNSYANWKSDQVGTGVLNAQEPALTQLLYWRSSSDAHELQLISPTDLLAGHLSFVGGLYYLNERFRTGEAYQWGTFACNLAFSTLPSYGACLANVGTDAFNEAFDQTTHSFAVYGQATVKFGSQFDLVLGARWTQDRKRADVLQVVNNASGGLVASDEQTSLRLKQDRPTWRANFNWHPSEDVLMFVSYSTGFKSGGFNSQTARPALGQGRIFDAETVKSYELGLKSQWFDRRVTFNLTAYQMDISDLQDRSYNGLGYSIRNAGNIRNRGVELDASARITEDLRFNFSAAYLDSVFTKYLNAAPLPGMTGQQVLTGKRPTFTPEWTMNGGLEYDREIGSGLTIGLRTDISYVSRMQINYQNDANPLTYQDGFALVSGRLSLYGPNRQWSVSVFGDNLTDQGYCSSIAYQPLGGLFGVNAPGITPLRCNTVQRPRTFGGAASFRF